MLSGPPKCRRMFHYPPTTARQLVSARPFASLVLKHQSYGCQKNFRLTHHFLRRNISGGIFYQLKCPPSAAGSARCDSWRLETIVVVGSSLRVCLKPQPPQMRRDTRVGPPRIAGENGPA